NLQIVIHEFDWISDPVVYDFEIQRPDGSSVRFSSLTSEDYSIVDRRGRTTRVWDDGSEVIIESGHGRTARLVLNEDDYIATIIAPDGSASNLDYDTNGLLVAITDADSNAI